jgi:hypothetical protein
MMKLRATIVALVLALGGYAIVHAASTINPNVPLESSPLSSAVVRDNFTAAYNDVNNILGKFAAPTAPLIPTPMQDWVNTSSATYTFNVWNPATSTWVQWGKLNTGTGIFSTGPVPNSIGFTQSVNFDNAGGDTQFIISLPPGYTRYLVTSVRISNASTSLTTATAGLFTSPLGAGIAIVTGGSAITVSSTTDATNNNAMSFMVNNSATTSYLVANETNLYFNIGVAEGAVATANVTITIAPLP